MLRVNRIPHYAFLLAAGLLVLVAGAWLSGLGLDPGQFMPHGSCYLWNPALLGLQLIADTPGTAVKVYLLKAQSEAERIESSVSQLEACGKEIILVVEDSDGVRRLVAGILKERGYEVMDAANVA